MPTRIRGQVFGRPDIEGTRELLFEGLRRKYGVAKLDQDGEGDA